MCRAGVRFSLTKVAGLNAARGDQRICYRAALVPKAVATLLKETGRRSRPAASQQLGPSRGHSGLSETLRKHDLDLNSRFCPRQPPATSVGVRS
ncbi:hypothetical protein MPC1_280006 [Methylocella tundrae]|nr:hypothetical protein MPC1_280006 [Methylocella tundrae]